MKPGVILVNTSRGGLIDTSAMIKGLKENRFGAVGLDVYEVCPLNYVEDSGYLTLSVQKEQEYFFQDSSDSIIQDDQLNLLLSFHTVLVTGHQAFFTEEVRSGD
jgi:D-lactate dehydrogenase